VRVSTPSLGRRWPLALLLVSLALTAIAALDAHRAIVSQDAMVNRAMREFSSFAAWSYGQRLEDRLSVMLRESLGAVNHGENLHMQRPVPKALNLAHNLPFDTRCNCHRTRFGPLPAALFAFKLGEDSLDVAINTHPAPYEGWEVDRPMPSPLPAGASPNYTAEDRGWILDTITRAVHAQPRPYRGFTLILQYAPPPSRVIAYTLMPTAWGDTMVYGAEYARTGMIDLFGDVLDNPGLLPATFTATHSNREVVVARVDDQSGGRLFDSAPGEASSFATRLETPQHLGGLSYEVVVRPRQANVLVIGGLPKSHLPFLLGVLGLAAALSVVAVIQIRREMQLARMRSDFVANVSHELRTPLSQIRLFTETLRTGRARTPEERDWSLGHIERETTRLGHLVDNVLRFSRVGHDDSSKPVPVDVGAETIRIVEEFRPLAASRNVTIESRIEPTPAVMLRPDALRRLLLNLLDNAVKYGPEGQTVNVVVRRHDGEAWLSVTDQGPGVKPAERESVWRPFQRGSAASIAAGSGIGLSVVRDVASVHGGRAWVENAGAPGSGARFVVALPVAGHPGNGA
jgi:signal transduction histidine kinase